MPVQPARKPHNPCFSSGPCAKPPGWSLAGLDHALLGRSHRSAEGKARLKAVIDQHRSVLSIPDDYRIGIVPGSDTGAIEMALWSLLGLRPVDVLAWEAFGAEWLGDVIRHLNIPGARGITAPYGGLPDLSAVNPAHDVVFAWNGTTGGVRVPDADWIAPDRAGLTFCDATSAVFAYDLPWHKLDITTWSWQKSLGGEAAHGMIVLSPRAVDRLLTYIPDRPLPKVFRMTADGALIDGLFTGETINTPSLLAVEDCLYALRWANAAGGLSGLMARVDANAQVVADWVAKTSWADFLCGDERARSKTSICLTVTDPWFAQLTDNAQRGFIKTLTGKIADAGAGYDLAGHARAPAGLRIWCGPTVEASDIALLLPWIDWAYDAARAEGPISR